MHNKRFLSLFYTCILAAGVWSCVNAGQITVDYIDRDPVVWNMNYPLKVSFIGAFVPTEYDLVLMDGEKEIYLTNKKVTVTPTNLTISAAYPAYLPYPLDERLMIKLWVPAIKSNVVTAVVVQDMTPPVLKVLAVSPEIKKGGSALVVFEADDANLKTVIIKDNTKKEFYPQPFQSEGYYLCFVGWYVKNSDYAAWIIASDEAGNMSTNKISLNAKDVKFAVGKVELGKTFGKDKTKELGLPMSNLEGIDKYAYYREQMIEKKKINIPELASIHPEGIIEMFKMKAFKPLLKWRVTSGFGKVREYYFEGAKKSESIHMGVDMANEPKDPIYAGNDGSVIFSGYNGGYGNTLVISHGMGLYSMYGHCTELLVKVGETVHAGDKIALTGKTGVASGDHLHFGMLIHGVYVNSEEWMNPYWIKTNVTMVLDKAKKSMKK